MSLNSHIVEAGFQELTIDLSTTDAFKLESKKDIDADVLIHLVGNGTSNFEIILDRDAKLNLFYLNESDEAHLNESYILNKDSRLDLAYGDFNEGICERNTDVYLVETGSSVYLKSASLVRTERRLVYRFNHQAQYTYGDMQNFVVTLDQGKLSLYAIGKIEKNAANSETHQTSRVLNFNANERASVYPQLFIDNNEVKASHAESSGQIDPDQLYYLQSRGLSPDESVSLIVKGYLSSIIENIKNDDIKERLMESIERKVDEVCSR